MTERPSGLGRDIGILLRYRWFILATFAIAVAGALTLGAVNAFDYEATSRAEIRTIEREPVFGGRFPINFDDYVILGATDGVAERAAAILTELGQPTSAGDIQAAVSQRDVTPAGFQAFGLRQLEFTASDGNKDKAIGYANAWAAAYTIEAEAYRGRQADEHVAALTQQVEAAERELDARLRELDAFLLPRPTVAPSSAVFLWSERARVSRALIRLKDIQANGGAGPEELQIALGDLFPPGSEPPLADLTTLITGLGLRLAALDSELADVAERGSDAAESQTLISQAEAARDTYSSALREAAAAQAAKEISPLQFRVIQDAVTSNSRQVGFAGLVAAAGALGLAAGVVGAFVLEYLGRNSLLPWRGAPGSPPSREP